MTIKGVSQCMPFVGVLYFDLFNPLKYSHLPLYLPLPRFSTAFSAHPYILYLYTLWYAILLMLYDFLFLSLFPQVPQSICTVKNTFYN
jgi:hypothetical protein